MRGSVENLVFEALSRRNPGPGEVEVGVETSALNFRDVLNVLGMYPGDAGPLGLEFYGRITRIGENITEYRPGDRVMGLAWESFASFVTTPAALICRVMDDLSPEQAANIAECVPDRVSLPPSPGPAGARPTSSDSRREWRGGACSRSIGKTGRCGDICDRGKR